MEKHREIFEKWFNENKLPLIQSESVLTLIKETMYEGYLAYMQINGSSEE
jgi:hypothetical protein